MNPNYTISPTILEEVYNISRIISPLRQNKDELHTLDHSYLQEVCRSSLKLDGFDTWNETPTCNERNYNKAFSNLYDIYICIFSFHYDFLFSLQKAHELICKDLYPEAGHFRKQNILLQKKQIATHQYPPPQHIEYLMQEFFKKRKEHDKANLVDACYAFYELTIIAPFAVANGRLSRFWWKVHLLKVHPIFAHLNLEKALDNNLNQFQEAIIKSQRSGDPVSFLELMLVLLRRCLENQQQTRPSMKTSKERMTFFLKRKINPFSRKEYLKTLPTISTATATRDLSKAVASGLLSKHGEKRNTIYSFKISKPSNSA